MACAKPFIRKMRRNGLDLFVPLPCGYCASCRRDKIRMWSDRLAFESIGKPSTFLTLTYNDESLPANKSVSLSDWQRFHDRLRHSVPQKYKYFVTSEYGASTYRPHYHVCLINFDWRDWKQYSAIDHAWEGKGFFDCSSLNSSRIRYCLKYMHKELKGTMKNDYEMLGLNPLFHTMSKGIGKDFFLKNIDFIRTHKGYYADGKLRPLPRYYADKLKIYEELSNSEFNALFKKYGERIFNYNVYSVPLFPEDILADFPRLRHLEKMDFIDDSNTIV